MRPDVGAAHAELAGGVQHLGFRGGDFRSGAQHVGGRGGELPFAQAWLRAGRQPFRVRFGLPEQHGQLLRAGDDGLLRLGQRGLGTGQFGLGLGHLDRRRQLQLFAHLHQPQLLLQRIADIAQQARLFLGGAQLDPAAADLGHQRHAGAAQGGACAVLLSLGRTLGALPGAEQRQLPHGIETDHEIRRGGVRVDHIVGAAMQRGQVAITRMMVHRACRPQPLGRLRHVEVVPQGATDQGVQGGIAQRLPPAAQVGGGRGHAGRRIAPGIGDRGLELGQRGDRAARQHHEAERQQVAGEQRAIPARRSFHVGQIRVVSTLKHEIPGVSDYVENG